MRPHDLPPAERFPHGTRARYVSGCRCEPCTIANRTYARERDRAFNRGDRRILVDATPARRHLNALSRRGIGYKAAAAFAGIGHTLAFRVSTGKARHLRAHHAAKILGVGNGARADGARIPSNATLRRVRRLVALGFSQAELARRLGMKRPALQFIRSASVTVETAERVLALETRIIRERAERRAATAARDESERRNRAGMLDQLRDLLRFKDTRGAKAA